MDPLLPQVIDLCELDREIHDLDEQLERYPKTLADLDARERAAVDRTAAAKSEHERAREARRKAELDVRALRDKIAGFELQQSRVKTNREYDAIKAEISAVEARIDEAEGRGLEALEIEERAEREMREAAEAVERLKGELAEERARIRGRIAEKRERLEAARAERRERLAPWPEDLRETYEMLDERYPGSAVAALADETCGGCGMHQVKQNVIDARKLDLNVRCENCSRILYSAAALVEARRGA